MGVPVRLDNLLRGMLHVTEVHIKQRRELHQTEKKLFVNRLVVNNHRLVRELLKKERYSNFG
jgi:hypothetical protein